MTAPTLPDMKASIEQGMAVLAASDWDTYRASFTDDAIYDEPCTGTLVKGPDAIVEVMKRWKEVFPDLTGKVERVIASGDTVVAEVTWTGTQRGSLHLGNQVYLPTGITGTVRGVEIMEMRGDKVALSRSYLDLATMLTIIGVLPR